MNQIYRAGIIIWLILSCFSVSGQEVKKQVYAVRITGSPEIDGVLSEEIWKDLIPAKDFIQYEPYNNKPVSFQSEIKLVYNNKSLYIAAVLYDPHPDSILKELGKRDVGQNNSDDFMVSINPYNDGLNSYRFAVSASGVQTDTRISPAQSGGHSNSFHWSSGEDSNWDAIWYSSVKITESGWIVEMEIPYSAIRFPNREVQVWGLNIWRGIRRYREKDTWSFVNKEVDGIENQSGELLGINNIDPPLRLSVIPYVSSYLQYDSEENITSKSFRGGMDMKYGLNESFTLDMTLIPDFGQIQSDDMVLNLSPYEIKYVEKRPFFTEGTDLFNKCEIFYSRRIGSQPAGYSSLYDSLDTGIYREIIKNPTESQLINATKISGRTRKGLGVGLFNAMTSETFAEVIDSSGNERKVRTNPFANYNLLVFDQILKNNSYISLINTNVNKYSMDYSADVTGTEFRVCNKKNTFSVKGQALISQIFMKDSISRGYKYYIETGKISGKFTCSFSQTLLTDQFETNDLGFQLKNNEVINNLNIGYNIYKAFWRVIWWRNNITVSHASLYSPFEYSDLNFNITSATTFRNYLSVGITSSFRPVEQKDFYEPRQSGFFYKRFPFFYCEPWLSSDYRKTFAYDLKFGTYISKKYNENSWWVELSPRVRISDKVMLIYRLEVKDDYNDIGFVDFLSDSLSGIDIIFGKRTRYDVINTFTPSYIINNKSSLNFRLRYYWSRVIYNQFYSLQSTGLIEEIDSYTGKRDLNVNIFNIDLVYTWQFRPGSELSFAWKNSIFTSENNIIHHFIDNLDYTINSPQSNSFSLKIIYYLDYQHLKRS